MKPCTGCGTPTTDVLTIPRLRLPYHPHCADQAERDLRDVLDGFTDALAARIAQRGPVSRAG